MPERITSLCNLLIETIIISWNLSSTNFQNASLQRSQKDLMSKTLRDRIGFRDKSNRFHHIIKIVLSK